MVSLNQGGNGGHNVGLALVRDFLILRQKRREESHSLRSNVLFLRKLAPNRGETNDAIGRSMLKGGKVEEFGIPISLL